MTKIYATLEGGKRFELEELILRETREELTFIAHPKHPAIGIMIWTIPKSDGVRGNLVKLK